MNYKLVKASNEAIEKLINYKKQTIFDYANNLSKEDIDKINNYVDNNIPEMIDDYQTIVIDNKVVGCVLVISKDDGVLLDELYLEEPYRGMGIGSNIINDIIKDNDVIYLWVYKNNKAVNLYQRLGFTIVDETDTRYYMKYIAK